MRLRHVISGLSIGLISGFVLGLLRSSLFVVLPNGYFRYKMHRLIMLSLNAEINRWVILSIFAVLVLFMLFYFVRLIWSVSFSRVLEINAKDKNRVVSLIVSFAAGILFFICGGWAINHYLLPGIFKPLSFLGNFGILVFSILLGWVLRNIDWTVSLKSIKRASLVIGVLVLGLNLWKIVDAQVHLPHGPNVLLISVETLRADHLGCYGYSRDTSPNVDGFAQGSLLFKNCFAHASSTAPSCSSILSGFFPHETGVLDNVTTTLSAKVNTLTEFLRNSGYATLAVVSNYILRREQGFNQGFEIYDDELEDKEKVRRVPERIAQGTTQRAIKYLRKNRQRRFFMWIHYQDPHGPYTPPPPYDTLFKSRENKSLSLRFNSALRGEGGIPNYQRLGDHRDYEFYVSQYDGEIRYFDHYFGELLSALKELRLADDTLIILTGDHGEGMGEHNFYFAHEEYVYDGLIHIPLIIRYGTQALGIRENYVGQISLMPTVLNLTGISASLPFRGPDLLAGGLIDQEVFSEQGDKYSIIVDPLKLIHHAINDEDFLYNLRKDREEEDNLIKDNQYADSLAMLKKRLDSLRHENLLALGRLQRPHSVSTEEKEKLRSLGYTK
jgi:arylsulfatase A-like enzyme